MLEVRASFWVPRSARICFLWSIVSCLCSHREIQSLGQVAFQLWNPVYIFRLESAVPSMAIEDVQASSLPRGLKALYLEHTVLDVSWQNCLRRSPVPGCVGGLGEGASLLQVKAYCGAWVHFLKATGAPGSWLGARLVFFLRPRFAN